ncbi:MAG: hypothetical protein WBN09_02055 [Woeseiaceae bacterium]
MTLKTLILVFLVLTASNVSAGELVREFSGTTNTTTAKFTVDSPWILDWYVNGDYQQLLALDIQLVNADTGFTVGRVLHTKRQGDGVKLFYSAGNYQLRISSTLARWRLKIEQLTEEEAQQYTPRRGQL